jgi:hypothetical protein
VARTKKFVTAKMQTRLASTAPESTSPAGRTVRRRNFFCQSRIPAGARLRCAQQLTSNNLADSRRVNLSDGPFAENGIDRSEVPLSVALE